MLSYFGNSNPRWKPGLCVPSGFSGKTILFDEVSNFLKDFLKFQSSSLLAIITIFTLLFQLFIQKLILFIYLLLSVLCYFTYLLCHLRFELSLLSIIYYLVDLSIYFYIYVFM